MKNVLDLPKSESGHSIDRQGPRVASAAECEARNQIHIIIQKRFDYNKDLMSDWYNTPRESLSGFWPYWFIKAGNSMGILNLMLEGEL